MNIYKKTLLATLFILSLSHTAFAADVTVTNTSVCTTVCASQTVGGNVVWSGSGGTSIPFLGPDVVASCIGACETLKARNIPGYVPESAASPTSNAFSRVMCNALRIVQGSAGKTFAAFAIIAVGIGFFSGKVSWGLMIGVAAGIAAMFGAPSIVAAISGQNTDMNCGTTL